MGRRYQGGRVRVVAAENFWGDIAEADRRQPRRRDVDHQRPEHRPAHLPKRPSRRRRGRQRAARHRERTRATTTSSTTSSRRVGGSGRRVLSVQKVLQSQTRIPTRISGTGRPAAADRGGHRPALAIDPSDARSSCGAKRFDRSLKPLLATIATNQGKYAGTKIALHRAGPRLSGAGGRVGARDAGIVLAGHRGRQRPEPAGHRRPSTRTSPQR